MLIKFGEPTHIEELWSEGILYMNTARYFRESEDGARGDRHEFINRSYPPEFIEEVTIAGRPFRVARSETPVALTLGTSILDEANIFCAYLVDRASTYVDPRNFTMGAAALVIDWSKFEDRLVGALENTRFAWERGPVRYVDRRLPQVGMDAFTKFAEYEYQHEYRVVLQTGASGPYQLCVGSLKDVAVMVEADQINNELRQFFNQLPPHESS